MLQNKIILMAFLICSLFYACEKPPGEGGRASIKGKVWVKDYDAFFTVLEQEYFAKDESVAITYGDHISPDKDEKTNSSGEFEFLYLRKGKYKITVYSKAFKDSLNPSGTYSVDTIIEITDRKKTYDIGTLIIQK